MKHNDQKIFRGDVFFADFTQATGSEISGTHPVIIVQNNIGNCHSSTVIGVVLTSRNKKESMPTHVVIDEPNVPKQDVSQYVTDLSREIMEEAFPYLGVTKAETTD